MTEDEIGELMDAGVLSVYGTGWQNRRPYDNPVHRLIFWQLIALSEGVYAG